MTQKLLQSFLFVYICILGYQLWVVSIASMSMWLAFIAGFIAAVFAHRKVGLLALLALVAHLVLECYYHAKHGFIYGGVTTAFHVVHVAFDSIFLVYQARAVSQRYFVHIVMAVLSALFVIGYVTYEPVPLSFVTWQPQHVHVPTVWQFLILGSIMGCVLMHGVRTKNIQN